MTPRQRWLALLDGRGADRIPTDYQATREVTSRLLADLDCADEESLFRKLQIDARRFVEPLWRRPDDREPDMDLWGVRYRSVNYGAGAYDEPVVHPLAEVESVARVHAYRWPRPDEFDYPAVTRELDALDGFRPVHAGCFEPFLLYGYLRGLERAFEDLLLRPEIAEAILGHIYDFYYEHHRRMFEAGNAHACGVGVPPASLPGRRDACTTTASASSCSDARSSAARGARIDLTYVAEDLGSQTGPLVSLAVYRRFLLPNQIKMADLARAYGIHVMYHTDGAARMFLPDLIDRVGIEVLNPIQWRSAGMEREGLVRDFGGRIVFHGSIDNQQTLAFGSVEDVATEVRQSVDIYRGARWICAPCHNLQPITPTQNVVALYETIRELGGL